MVWVWGEQLSMRQWKKCVVLQKDGEMGVRERDGGQDTIKEQIN